MNVKVLAICMLCMVAVTSATSQFAAVKRHADILTSQHLAADDITLTSCVGKGDVCDNDKIGCQTDLFSDTVGGCSEIPGSDGKKRCIDIVFKQPSETCTKPSVLIGLDVKDTHTVDICAGSGTCTEEGSCKAGKGLGCACTDGDECISDQCELNKCALGDTYYLSEGDTCVSDAQCFTKRCRDGVCAARAVGDGCARQAGNDPSWDECGANGHCNLATNLCEANNHDVAVGGDCEVQSQCTGTLANACNKGKCVALGSVADGGACDIGFACASYGCAGADGAKVCGNTDNKACNNPDDCSGFGNDPGLCQCGSGSTPQCIAFTEVVQNVYAKGGDLANGPKQVFIDLLQCQKDNSCSGSEESAAIEGTCMNTHCLAPAIAQLCATNCVGPSGPPAGGMVDCATLSLKTEAQVCAADWTYSSDSVSKDCSAPAPIVRASAYVVGVLVALLAVVLA